VGDEVLPRAVIFDVDGLSHPARTLRNNLGRKSVAPDGHWPVPYPQQHKPTKENLMLWQASTELQRHTPCGQVAMPNAGRAFYLTLNEKPNGWRE
jgi:hypothetical protein